MKRVLLRYTRVFHKWAGLFLALQILLWILGGLVMSAIPLEMVHGKHLANKQIAQDLTSSNFSYSIDQVLANINEDVVNIEFTEVLGVPHYRIQTINQTILFNSASGKKVSAVNEQQAKQIAQQHYLGKAKVKQSRLLDSAPMEASANQGAVWQIVFDDRWQTTLYVSPTSGKMTTVRSRIWRIFDFFWMLHIMDYDERDDFNNPLLISFAASSLIFTLSGFVLLFNNFRYKRWKKNAAFDR